MNTYIEIKECLKSYRFFQECVIEEIILADFGTTAEIVINYVWDENGELRHDITRPQFVRLKFTLLERLLISNALTKAICEHPSALNWGFNEIAAAEVDDRTYPYTSGLAMDEGQYFNRIILRWEGERSIELVFRDLRITNETAD